MDLQIDIELLSEQTSNTALEIAVAQHVGEYEEIQKFFERSLEKKLNNTFIAKLDDKVVGIIGWYIDSGDWAGKL